MNLSFGEKLKNKLNNEDYLDYGDNLDSVGRQMNLSFWGRGI